MNGSVQRLRQGRHAVLLLENGHHSSAEIIRIPVKRFKADLTKGSTHRLGIPEQLSGRPGHHAHRVVARLDQALIKPVLLEMGVGLQADEENGRLTRSAPKISSSSR